jgi:cell division transport system permease protein
VGPDALPESYRVKLHDPKQFDVVASAFQDRPGVDTVQDLKKLLDPVFNVLDGFSLGALGVAIFMLVAAILLIAMMIQVSTFSRRREIGIMRLVGASNFYIQLPFLLEGAIAGLVGAVLATGWLAVGKWFMVDQLLRKYIKFTTFIGWDAVVGTVPYLLTGGIAIAVVASYVSLLRYLRV